MGGMGKRSLPVFVSPDWSGYILRSLQAAVGFEPTNHGFAIRSLSPLGHAADDDTPGLAGALRARNR